MIICLYVMTSRAHDDIIAIMRSWYVYMSAFSSVHFDLTNPKNSFYASDKKLGVGHGNEARSNPCVNKLYWEPTSLEHSQASNYRV